MNKNFIVFTITILSFVINVIFSVLVVWVNNLILGPWYILWAIAILWLFIFMAVNLPIPKKNRKPRNRK